MNLVTAVERIQLCQLRKYGCYCSYFDQMKKYYKSRTCFFYSFAPHVRRKDEYFYVTKMQKYCEGEQKKNNRFILSRERKNHYILILHII